MSPRIFSPEIDLELGIGPKDEIPPKLLGFCVTLVA